MDQRFQPERPEDDPRLGGFTSDLVGLQPKLDEAGRSKVAIEGERFRWHLARLSSYDG